MPQFEVELLIKVSRADIRELSQSPRADNYVAQDSPMLVIRFKSSSSGAGLFYPPVGRSKVADEVDKWNHNGFWKVGGSRYVW